MEATQFTGRFLEWNRAIQPPTEREKETDN